MPTTTIAPDFDMRWSTSTTDEAWARALLDPELRDLVEAIPNASEVRIASGELRLVVPSGVRDEASLDACVAFAAGATERVRAGAAAG